MKLAIAIAALIVISGCASAPRYTAQPSIQQEVEVRCVASNAVKSGCTTSHEIAISTRFAPADTGVPTLHDLSTSSPRPIEY